ncbi:MAG: helix-turn-helix domain-containing protein [Thermodesulfobacteriota bacterium]
MSFASRIRERRKALGITKAKLAKLAGLTRPSITRYEKGLTKNPNAHSLERLADVLGVTADYLLGRGSNFKRRS